MRIIAATNRDLQSMVADGKFREDLYFRLGMFHIVVPPLRERREDIKALLEHVLRGMAVSNGVGRLPQIDSAAEEVLMAYHWPGNVREVENVLNRAHLMADGDRITLADIPPQITRAIVTTSVTPLPANPGFATVGNDVAPTGDLRELLRRYENQVISLAIAAAGGDRRAAAGKLGIGLSSLYRKLEEFSTDTNAADVAPSEPLAQK